MDELFCAIKQGKPNKAPRRDGICLEFCKHKWETTKQDLLDIMNDMYREGKITYQQKYGIIVCIPKQGNPTCPEDYRPLSLLNTDYKLLTRIIANRLRIWMKDILHPAHHFAPSETTVFEALATVRNAMAYAELSGTPMCILTIDFLEAFNRISTTICYNTEETRAQKALSATHQKYIQQRHISRTDKWLPITTHSD
jgi:hypothetical protein